jgi:hypothetical protein
MTSLFEDANVDRRSLDRFVLDQDTTVWIVLAAAIALILGLVLRAARAERKRQREDNERARTD